jgi:hypothetical protein
LGESGLRPNATGDNGTSYGIAQWHLGRWDNLKSFSKKQGLDPSTIEAQSQFLMHELNNAGYSSLVSILKDPNVSTFDATKAFLQKFERPADQSDDAVQRRLNRGNSALGIKGGGNPGYGTSMPESSSSGFNNQVTTPNLTANGNKTVNITVTFDQANEANAQLFAKKVQSYLEDVNNVSTIGTH